MYLLKKKKNRKKGKKSHYIPYSNTFIRTVITVIENAISHIYSIFIIRRQWIHLCI